MVYIKTNQKAFAQDEDLQRFQLPLSVGSTNSSSSDTLEVFNENHLFLKMGLACVESDDELYRYLPADLIKNFKQTYLAKRAFQESSIDSEESEQCKKRQCMEEQHNDKWDPWFFRRLCFQTHSHPIFTLF